MLTISERDILLFQGDSITEGGRDHAMAREPGWRHRPATLGLGYAGKIAAALVARHPGIGVYNRGVSGDQVTDLADRWQRDCLAIKPTVLSILVGINDTWVGAARGTPQQDNSLERFDSRYRALLDQASDALPGVSLVLCEPFTTATGVVLELDFYPELAERQAIIRRIAADYDAVWVPFQALFDRLCERAPPNHWAFDGVHPMAAGHHEMARFWLQSTGVEPEPWR